MPQATAAEGEAEREGAVFHVEPPSTRVVGVLDPGFELVVPDDDAHAQADPERELPAEVHRGDPLEDSYIHPCFVGRLPIPWLPGRVQPRAVMRARQEEGALQHERRRKWMARQRLGRAWDATGAAGATVTE